MPIIPINSNTFQNKPDKKPMEIKTEKPKELKKKNLIKPLLDYFKNNETLIFFICSSTGSEKLKQAIISSSSDAYDE